MRGVDGHRATSHVILKSGLNGLDTRKRTLASVQKRRSAEAASQTLEDFSVDEKMMNRRRLLRSLAITSIAGVAESVLPRHGLGQTVPRYEVRGRGPVLFVGPPITAAKPVPGADPLAKVRDGYLERLTDRYRVVLLDYPPTGNDARAIAGAFTPDRVCADILAVADAVGADRFAWYG